MMTGPPVPDLHSDVAENVTKEEVKASIRNHCAESKRQYDEMMAQQKELRRKEMKELAGYLEREPWMVKPFTEMSEEEFILATCYMAQEFYIETGTFLSDIVNEAEAAENQPDV